MPGRKPTAIKKTKGTLQPCRANPNEPQLSPELPAPPAGLSPRVRDQYMVVGSRLLDMRVMTRADVDAVVGAAQAWADWRSAVEAIEAAGGPIVEIPIYAADNGEQIGVQYKAHPAVAMRNEADRRHRGWLQSLGLTPVDRARVSAIQPQEKTKLAQLVEMKRSG
jgi:P27 family predicted phage terminase small subunit